MVEVWIEGDYFTPLSLLSQEGEHCQSLSNISKKGTMQLVVKLYVHTLALAHTVCVYSVCMVCVVCVCGVCLNACELLTGISQCDS